MPARVTIEIVRGASAGRQYVFDERTTCIVGRADDCNLRIPTDPNNPSISRHHCLLDVRPPSVRLRDLGSLNGTYVNGRRIQPCIDEPEPAEDHPADPREYDLKNGDEISLGNTVLRVGISISPDDEPPAVALPDVPASPPEPSGAARGGVCAKCGREVSCGAVSDREGDYVCVACQTDPRELMKLLLDVTTTGHGNLFGIDQYEIVKPLGRGRTGAVYLARDKRSGRRVAFRVMLPGVATSVMAVQAFLRETANLRALHHENVVRLYDAACAGGTFFVTSELAGGGTVEEMVRRRGGRLPVDEAVRITLEAAAGLQYAHAAKVPFLGFEPGGTRREIGLVHGDLSPRNLFLFEADELQVAKLGDYGLARAFDLAGLGGHAQTGAAAGAAEFMPRQRVAGYRQVGPEVDVWALAASLYYMLTGAAPRDFSADSDPWQTVLESDPVPIRRRNPSLPERLAEVIDHALRDEPEIGFATCTEFRQALQEAVSTPWDGAF